MSAATHAPRPRPARAEPGPARAAETPEPAGGEHALALALHPGAGRAPAGAAPPPAPPPPPSAKTLRRTCAHGCDEELVVRRTCAACAAAQEIERRTGVRQPLCPSCEREREAAELPLQRRAGGDGGAAAARDGGAMGDGGRAASVRAVLGSGGGRPLDPGTRAFFEARFGRGMGGVRVHTGPQADASARAVDALAYTVGHDVVFRAGYYAPATAAGKRLLAHELAHTLQQGQAEGPSLQGFTVSRPGDPAEREADAAADAVLHGRPVPAVGAAPAAVARECDAGEAVAVDTSSVSDAADRIIDLLDGYTSRWDSEAILNEFSLTDGAYDSALLDELKRRDGGIIDWLFTDMTAEDGRKLRCRLLTLHAAGNLLELLAADIVDRLGGWTSEADSHAILNDFSGLTGGEIDALLGLVEGRAEMDSDATREWLFGDMDAVTGFKLAQLLYDADAPRASAYAAGWTVERVYSMVSGYTSHADSTTIVQALEQVPESRQDYVRYRLDTLCRAGRDQGLDDTLMEDLDVADYVRLQKIPEYRLRPYDRQPSWYEEGWETIVSYLDYGLVLVEWVACGLVGVVTGILSVVWDIVVLVKDIVVAVWDLLGSLVYLLSGGAAGSGEWLAVKDFFRGIGHLFSDPGAVFSQMWDELTAEFDSIEGPLTQCRRAEFIVRKFINAIINIILIFVAGYGAVKGLAAGAQGVAQFANMVREIGFVRAVAKVSGKVVTAGKGALGAGATAVGELSTALRSPVKLLGQVRGRLSKVLMAAEKEGYWNYLRSQARAGVKGTLEDEAKFWREQREYWRTRGQAQQAREAELGRTVGEVDATLQEGKVPEGAEKTIATADEQAKALDAESSQLHDEVTGARTTKPVETKPVETKPVETKPVETKPVETKPVETKPAETKPVETNPVETKPVDPVKVADEEGVTAKATTKDGQHEVRIKHRTIERCSVTCEVCRRVHGPLLEERPDLDRLLARLEALAAQDDTKAVQVAAEAALLDQRARTIYELRALGTADLEARAAAAAASGDMVIANEARYVLARRTRPNLTYEQFSRETLGTALGEGTAAELERAFGSQGLPGLADNVGGERLGRLLTGATPDELAALSESIGTRALGALGQDLTGTEVKALLAEWSESTVGWAAGELRGSEVRPLLTGLDEHSMRHLRDVRPSELLELKNRLGASYLSTLGAQVDASALRHMFATMNEDVARAIISERRQTGTLGQLNDFGRNIGQGKLTAAEGGTGELVSPPPVTAGTGVLDTQMSVYINEGRAGLITGTPWTGLTSRQQMALDRLIGMTTGECRAGMEQLKAGTPWGTLTPARQEAVRTLSPATGGVDLRVNPITVAEEGAPGAGLSRTGFNVAVDRNSAQYREVLRELEEIPNLNAGRTGESPFVSVGGGGEAGAADRAVVADALFASNPTTPLTLYTADEGVYKALAQRAGINPRTTPEGIHVKYRDGFLVTSPSTGLKIRVIPIK